MASSVIPSALLIKEYDGLRLQHRWPSSLSVRANKGALPSLQGEERRGGSLVVRAVATPSPPPASLTAKRSKVEFIKEESSYLRYPLLDDLKNAEPNVSPASEQLIKFHGSYQQENRELRRQGVKSWQFMMRTRQPGGKVSNLLYKTMDDLANQYGNGSLRLTTRQTFQLHGILKENMKTVFSSVIRSMGSTLGACGDLNRNILAPAVPYVHRKDYLYCQEYADKIADLLAPQAGAYYDVWMDGEKVFTSEAPEVTAARKDPQNGATFVGSPEPIYGTQFLPRKFKIAITVPGDNSVDILTNDLGLVVIMGDDGELSGFNILVGGGMGRTHKTEKTFPALAKPLGFVPKEDIYLAVKAIVATQRDYGRRDDRRQARLKYLINDWGIDKFRIVAEQYYGKSFQPFCPLPAWNFNPYVGWGAQGDGKLYFGLHIDNGRIKGEMKKAIRFVIEKFDLPLRITANQNLILCDIRPAWKARITKILSPVGLVTPNLVDPLNVLAMACPALPLCGLAIAEAERSLPDLLKRIRGVLEKVGLKKFSESMVIRMTGCPNGCARPYMAEIGFVGDGANSYQLYLGGSPHQTRLAEVFLERVKVQDIETTLEPLFFYWKLKREAGEAFGDFVHRVGFEELKAFMEVYKNPRSYGQKVVRTNRMNPRVSLEPSVFESVSITAKEWGVPVSQITTEALEKYLKER